MISTLSLDDSLWSLTANSEVGTLQAANGSHVDVDRHRLDVHGDLDSNATHFTFAVDLGDDASAAGRLHVQGDARGTGTIGVTRLGASAGAQTIDGIPLITVDGASLADFSLAGRAVGGAYEYFLHKGGVVGGEGNWYLRSSVPTLPDPCVVTPSLPGCTPWTRPIRSTRRTRPIRPIRPIRPA